MVVYCCSPKSSLRRTIITIANQRNPIAHDQISLNDLLTHWMTNANQPTTFGHNGQQLSSRQISVSLSVIHLTGLFKPFKDRRRRCRSVSMTSTGDTHDHMIELNGEELKNEGISALAYFLLLILYNDDMG